MAMDAARPHFSVTLEARIPPFESERRFVAAEQGVARRKIAELKAKRQGVLATVIPKLAGAPGVQVWEHYIVVLDHYAKQLDKHEAEVNGGLVPVKFFVINNGRDDSEIRVQIRIENGAVHPAKVEPRRPARVDEGPVHVPALAPVPAKLPVVLSGFARTEIKVGTNQINSKLSVLAADDSADVVNQVLYVLVHDDTTFHYEIRSRNAPEPERGEVEIT